MASVNASVVGIWDLTNKSPGALGPNYGLRLNNLQGIVGGSGKMLFDFNIHQDADVKLKLLQVGTGTGLEL